MEVCFADDDLDRLETDPDFENGLPPEVVRAYRKAMQYIRASVDERDFRERRSWNFKKLQGQRSHQHSIRLNDQFRLIVEFEGVGASKRVRIVGVGDYH